MGFHEKNSQIFEKEIIIKWLKSYSDVIKIIVTLHILKYPLSVFRYNYYKKFKDFIPSFGGFVENDINIIASIFSKKYFDDIESTANDDSNAKEFIESIDSMSDLEDFDEEGMFIESAKSLIKHVIGYNKWHESIENQIYLNDSHLVRKTLIDRIEVIKAWAIENNLIDS